MVGPNFTFDADELGAARAGLDIKPGVELNPINLRSRGALSVAILTTDVFDALAVDVETILFGDPVLLNGGATGVEPLRSREKDVNGDGLIDLMLKFSIRDLVDNGALGDMSLEAILTGLTSEGTPFERFDSVRIVPKSRHHHHQRRRHRHDRHRSAVSADYTIWATNFGTSVGGGPQAVPEPSSIALACFGLFAVVAYGRPRRGRA